VNALDVIVSTPFVLTHDAATRAAADSFVDEVTAPVVCSDRYG
jgi:hypothetical protein